MECSCVPCSLDGRGDTTRARSRSRSRAVAHGSVVTQRATDVIRFRCPHMPGCGGCETHIPDSIVATEDELRQTLVPALNPALG